MRMSSRRGQSGAPWIRIPLAARRRTGEAQLTFDLSIDRGRNSEFRRLLTANGALCLLELRFQPLDPLVEQKYDFATGSTWSFEIIPKMADLLGLVYELKPLVEIPNFDLRKSWFPDQYTLQVT